MKHATSPEVPGWSGPGQSPVGSEFAASPTPPAINFLIASILRGDYRPLPGSAGEVLLQSHPSQDRYTAGRSLAIFAKVATRSQGIWWPAVLEARPETLAADEETYLVAAWRQWCAGVNPFTGGRRVVA